MLGFLDPQSFGKSSAVKEEINFVKGKMVKLNIHFLSHVQIACLSFIFKLILIVKLL